MSSDSSSPGMAQQGFQFLVRVLGALFVVGVLLAYGIYFAVTEGQAAVVTRFGEPVREITSAGPHGKWPWPIEQVHFFDTRLRIFNTPYTATFTRDKRSIILLTYVVWHVEKPLLFLQSVGNAEVAEKKIDGMVTAAKNIQLGRYDLSALISTLPENLKVEEIEDALLVELRGPLVEKFGIHVDQVGFKRIAFAEENVPAVLAHMRSERKAEADRLRAEGDKEAQAIRDAALVKSEETLREGREQAGQVRGQAEKDAARIYADAQDADPDFYRFWRSLEAAKKVLAGKATLILRTDQGFFDVLNFHGETAEPPLVSPRTTNSTEAVSPRRDRKQQ